MTPVRLPPLVPLPPDPLSLAGPRGLLPVTLHQAGLLNVDRRRAQFPFPAAKRPLPFRYRRKAVRGDSVPCARNGIEAEIAATGASPPSPAPRPHQKRVRTLSPIVRGVALVTA